MDTNDYEYKKAIKKWRVPTKEEWEELQKQCDWRWTKQNNLNGFIITSRKTSNSIFLPAAGMFNNDEFYSTGYSGTYWSSTYDGEFAYIVDFDGTNVLNINLYYPEVRCTVRPVAK